MKEDLVTCSSGFQLVVSETYLGGPLQEVKVLLSFFFSVKYLTTDVQAIVRNKKRHYFSHQLS